MRRRLMFFAIATSLACGVAADGPPAIEVDRTACSHCGMLVSEPVYAAAYRAPRSASRVFDDIGCLLEAARKEPEAEALRFWFHDAAGGGWIPGAEAVLVRSPELRTPMGGGLVAYRERAAAERLAAERHGRVESLPALLKTH
jgi:copper chaperone NosL